MSPPDTDLGFNRKIQAFLAVSITVGFFGVILGLMFGRDIPTTMKDILLVMLGALLASYKELTGYFFGSSSGSATKDNALAVSSAVKDTALAAVAVQTNAAAPELPRNGRRAEDIEAGTETTTMPTTTTITTRETK